MKKIFSFLLMICISISCCACGNKDVNVSSESQTELRSTTTSKQSEVTTTSAKSTTTTSKQSEVTTTSAKSTTTTNKQSEVTTAFAKSTTTTNKPSEGITPSTAPTTRPKFDPLKPDKSKFKYVVDCPEIGKIIDFQPFGLAAVNSPMRRAVVITADGAAYNFAFGGVYSTTDKCYQKIETTTKFKSFYYDSVEMRCLALSTEDELFELGIGLCWPATPPNRAKRYLSANGNQLSFVESEKTLATHTFSGNETIEKLYYPWSWHQEEATIKTNKGWYRIQTEITEIDSGYVDVGPTEQVKLIVDKIQLEEDVLRYCCYGDDGALLIDKNGTIYYNYHNY